ncbi:MAG: hypothetical protein K9M08_04440 [Pirellula sp.]|nr:hypothetical protein [Pirellula sp.]
MPSGFMPVVIDLRSSVKVTIPWDKPRGIQCMPSGFTPVVIDLRPSMKVTIPWDKPKGIQCMPSGFMPVVIDLRPSMKVTIPWGKLVNWCNASSLPTFQGIENQDPLFFVLLLSSKDGARARTKRVKMRLAAYATDYLMQPLA